MTERYGETHIEQTYAPICRSDAEHGHLLRRMKRDYFDPSTIGLVNRLVGISESLDRELFWRQNDLSARPSLPFCENPCRRINQIVHAFFLLFALLTLFS